uniref:Uncharacterized protein n=1 Tax=Chromera velia CCMP2878 TaxID=1169474 RepID=A0A0G4H4H8_9ALVE|eukprot:Cvel_5698.t1-p1 / transcript=Cvel_5698.t1 / gene=Cvel_5698 / organism=Chromera_velia_CCMP2878 / gene_product=hypothetical protein / transcript_product=hypothetical protein / location=Cvel_scaffold269:64951-66441(+) / protein_length=497 / sequence_SO=supercontig / SO=protein_coding / is_pseudo=false
MSSCRFFRCCYPCVSQQHARDPETQSDSAPVHVPIEPPNLPVSWADVMRTRGEEVWRCRSALLQAAGTTGVALLTGDARHKPHCCMLIDDVQSSRRGESPQEVNAVLLVTDTAVFQDLEGRRLITKGHNQKADLARGLTNVDGMDWARQRAVLCTAVFPSTFANDWALLVAERHAGACLSFLADGTVGTNGTVLGSDAGRGWELREESGVRRKELNLKEMLLTPLASVFAEIVVGAACVSECEEQMGVVGTFLEYWKELHARSQNQKRRKVTHRAVMKVLENVQAAARAAQKEEDAKSSHCDKGNRRRSLLASMLCVEGEGGSQMRSEEIGANLLSFFTAGFETCLSVITCTLLSLGESLPAHTSVRTAVHEECVRLERAPELRRRQIDLLKELKHRAVRGESLPSDLTGRLEDSSDLGENGVLLVRCILETLRMFPPVVVLPRKTTKAMNFKMSARNLRAESQADSKVEKEIEMLKGSLVRCDVLCRSDTQKMSTK